MNILIDVDGIGVVIEQKFKVSKVKGEDLYRYLALRSQILFFSNVYKVTYLVKSAIKY